MSPVNHFIKKDQTLFLGILYALWIILFAVMSFDGYYFYDDFHYGKYASQILDGSYTFQNDQIFAHRFGFLLPIALLYKVFGINDFSNLLLPILCSIVSLILSLQISKKIQPKAMPMVALMLTTCFYFLFFANKLYPDVLLTTQVLGVVFLLIRQQDSPKLWRVLPFVMLNVWAFLTKELIIFLIPMYLFLAVQSILIQKDKALRRFWIYSGLGAMLMAGLFLLMYKLTTGAYMYRFHLIQDQHYTASYSYFDKPFVHTLRRITYEPLFLMLGTGLITVLSGLWLSRRQRNSASALVLLASYFILGSFWWISTSTRYYNPIGLFPRHILMLLPLGAIITGSRLGGAQREYLTPVVLLVSALVAYFVAGLRYSLLYGVLALLIFAQQWTVHRKTYKGLKLLSHLALVVVLFAHPVYHMYKRTESGYQEEKVFFKNEMPKVKAPAVIYTDDKLYNGHAWYSQYKEDPNITYKELTDLPKDIKGDNSHHVYLLINQYNISYFKKIGTDYTQYYQDLDTHWSLVSEQGKMALYRRLE